MKYFALILSFYFLGLNFVPCEDAGELSGKDPLVQEINQDLKNTPNDTDDCSPFCQCHCCHVHVTKLDFTSSKTIEAISTLIIQKGKNSGQEIPNFHFQPPKV